MASQGSTIVELLIVIVVIGILASLAVTAFAEARDKAKAAAVTDGIRNTERSIKAYAVA